MKTTIRVKLSSKAIKMINFQSNDGLKSNKSVIDSFVNEESAEYLKNKILRRNLDNNKITSIKSKYNEEFKKNETVYKSYVISKTTQKTLRDLSKELGLTISMVLSVIIEDILDELTIFSMHRNDDTKEFISKMFEIKNRINSDVNQMYNYWQQILTLHPEDETKTPFFQTLSYFFEGFYGFDQNLKQHNKK